VNVHTISRGQRCSFGISFNHECHNALVRSRGCKRDQELEREQIAKAEERASRCMASKLKDCEAEPKSWWQKLTD